MEKVAGNVAEQQLRGAITKSRSGHYTAAVYRNGARVFLERKLSSLSNARRAIAEFKASLS